MLSFTSQFGLNAPIWVNMDKNTYQYQDLLIKQIEFDSNQPRKDFGIEGDENRLKVSIKEHGILDPIKVSEVEDNRFKIIDGHRRYIVAQKLGFQTIPCIVYPELNKGDLETNRFELQTNQRRWKPSERSEALNRIRIEKGFTSNRELAELLGLSETVVANSLQLRDLILEYHDLMAKYDLSEAYRIEFMRLKPKLRKLGNMEVNHIIENIFERIQNHVIKNAKDLRKLGRIFLRATANEKELNNFLSDPDMTIEELEQRTLQSGSSLLVEQLIKYISTKRQKGIDFSSQERAFLEQLRTLLNEAL